MKKQSRNNNSPFHIYPREGLEILICILSISLAVAIAITPEGLGIFFDPLKLFSLLLVFIFTIGVGFVLHELAHKAVAISYGARARFIMWPKGLAVMFITAIFGFVLAAPGAVYIFSRSITNRQNGLISVAGPLTNILLSFVFLFFYWLAPVGFFPINIWMFGAYINALLAAFNLIPLGPLDGRKVFAWSIPIWAILIVFSVWLMFALGGSLL